MVYYRSRECAAASPSGKAEVCKTSTPSSNLGAALFQATVNTASTKNLSKAVFALGRPYV